MARFDRQAVIEAIRQLSRDGMMPRTEDYDKHRKEHGLCSQKVAVQHMGSWESVANELGLKYAKKNHWTNEQLRAAAVEMSSPPLFVTGREWDRGRPKGAPSNATIRLRFGSWKVFAAECGLKTFIRWEDEPIVTSSSTSEPIAIRPREPMLNEGFMVDNFKPSKRA